MVGDDYATFPDPDDNNDDGNHNNNGSQNPGNDNTVPNNENSGTTDTSSNNDDGNVNNQDGNQGNTQNQPSNQTNQTNQTNYNPPAGTNTNGLVNELVVTKVNSASGAVQPGNIVTFTAAADWNGQETITFTATAHENAGGTASPICLKMESKVPKNSKPLGKLCNKATSLIVKPLF